LVNIGRTIAKISERDFTRKIYLRKGDFLKNEAKQINTMMAALSNSIDVIKRENLLLLEDIEESIQARGRQTEIDAKLKSFQDRADRCRVHLDNFQLIGDSTNKVGTGQRQQLVSDNPLSANKCL
jgi:predicted  nucleic acid-binding Zn ribbon protein